jgi:sugar phosphate permease
MVLARSVQCFLLCGTRIFQQSMRNTLTNVLIYMEEDMEISIAAKGSMLAAVATGYFFTQVPGGMLADKFGAKNVMTCALACSAICCLLVPTAGDAYGLSGMWVVMALMGAVQGPMFPTSSVFLSLWMPKALPGKADEKAWGTSMLDIGISVGSLLIIPVVTTLADHYGWRNTFHFVGAASLCFVAIWAVFASPTPDDCWYISDEERAYLQEHVSVSPRKKPRQKLLTPEEQDALKEENTLIGMPYAVAFHPGVWAVFLCHMAFNFGAYYLTNWSPTYYHDVLKLGPQEAKYHLMLPHATNLAAKFANPLLLAHFAASGQSLLTSRKAFTCYGFMAAAAFLAPVYALRSLSPWVSTILLSLTNACFGFAPSGFKANYLDITEDHVGILAGYGNTLGTVASVLGPKLTSWQLIFTNQNWQLVMWTVCAVNVCAAVNYSMNAVTTPIEQLVSTKGGGSGLFKKKALQ